MILCSACLLGIKCRYDSRDKLNKKILEIFKKETVIPVCPEILAGFDVPRERCEIVNGDGFNVLERKARVVTESGRDVTEFFLKGAYKTLELAKKFEISFAVLKQNSPSCGCGKIYDGSFSGKIIQGYGVTAALLKKHGIKVVSEEEL